MNPLVKKEVRLLLPAWMVALLLALPPVCTRSDDGIPVVLLFIGMTLMALSSIGRETTLNTFSQLLSLPAERTRIWRVKLSVLSVAFLMVFAVWRLAFAFSFKDYGGRPADVESTHAVLFASWMTLITTFTGALWTTILLRQVAGALWITLLAPACLAGITAVFLDGYDSTEIMIGGLSVVLGIYSLAGFLFARWLFFRAQDIGWSGGVIILPEWKLFSTRSESIRVRRPVFALVRKEFQLQQISLLGAAGLLVLHAGIVVLRPFHTFPHFSTGDMLVSFFWILWLVLPMTIGCMAVADERRLGVTEGQLCLPVSRRVQFAIKGFLALFLGIALGGVIPLLLEFTAAHLGSQNEIFKPSNFQGNDFFSGIVWFRICVAAFAAWLVLASFFASSLAKNFLQAVGFAFATLFGIGFIGSMFSHWWPAKFFGLFSYAPPQLMLCIAIPTIIVTLLVLAYVNYKSFLDGWPLWRRNLLGAVGAFVFIAVGSSAIYNRAWEIFEPAEPAHGPAIFSPANPPVLQRERNVNFSVHLPDGRIWFCSLGGFPYDGGPGKWRTMWHALVNPLPKGTGPRQFMGGSNWLSATTARVDFWDVAGTTPGNAVHVEGYLDTVGVRQDGTLWISEMTAPKIWTGATMIQYGSERDWRQVGRLHAGILLLKTNDTLWEWGSQFYWDELKTNWPTARTSVPRQIGTNSDWSEIIGRLGCVRKVDGSFWFFNRTFNKGKETGQLEIFRETNLTAQVQIEPAKFSGIGNGRIALVGKDGTLWIGNRYWNTSKGNWVGAGVSQIGIDTNWSDISITWNRLVALKSDGSLWQWKIANQESSQVLKETPARLGIHSDWIGLADTWDGIVSMSADGSLWFWPDNNEYNEVLMKLPKQPQFLGNVFGKAN